MRGWAVRILRQCVEGTAVMKVSCHRVERLRSPSPACHGTETLREGVAVWHGHVQPPPGWTSPMRALPPTSSEAVAAVSFPALVPVVGSSRSCGLVHAGSHRGSSTLAMLISPASL